jgi:hypothetical protein
MDGLVIFCKLCRAGYTSIGEIPSYCPHCYKPTSWTTFAPPDVPRVPFKLTVDDKRLLRQLRIAPPDDLNDSPA